MENHQDQLGEQKIVAKAKSYSSNPPVNLNNESMKRKSFNANEAVRSLDLALGRLKKSKLVNGEYDASAHTSLVRHSSLFMNMDSASRYNGMDNASLMSMNFSHYELMRNLSRSNCNSDGEMSETTCSAFLSQADPAIKDEHLEKYFRSAEMWSRKHKDCDPSTFLLEFPTEK